MRQPVHGKATEVAIEQSQMIEHPLSAILRERDIVAHDDLPVFLGALGHIVKLRAGFVAIHIELPLPKFFSAHAIMALP